MAQRADGIDTSRRIVKSRKAQKQDAITRWVIGVFVGIIVFTLSALFLMGQGIPQRMLTAAEVGGERIRVNEFEYHYHMAVVSFMEEFGEMASWFGFDPSLPHGSLYLDEESGYTWKDYFIEQAMNSLLDTVANAQEATANGMALTDWEHFLIDDYINQIRSRATSSGQTMNRMLTNMFGRGTTEASLRVILERLVLSDMWKDSVISSFSFTEQEVQAQYLLSPNDYDMVTFHILMMAGDVEGEDPTEEEYEAAYEEALQRAEAMMTRATAANFYSLALEYGDQADREWLLEEPDATLTRYVRIAELMDFEELGEWLADPNRRAGDKTVVSENLRHSVLLFVSRTGFPQTGVDVRHVLIQPTDDEEAKAEAEALLAQWRADGATQEAFGLLAEEHSRCGSAVDGGLFEEVLRGDMVPEFNDWIFAPNRRPGDSGIVMTQFGYHLMYFVGQSENPVWPRDRQGNDMIRTALLHEAFMNYQDELLERFTVTPNSLGLRFLP
jgi:parvulin-like peptidyl-prolyl isomerase